MRALAAPPALRRRPRAGRRGMTLVEALVAMTVLATGVAALFGMINRVQGANRTMAFQTNALDAFSRVSAQIRDAECVLPNGAARALAQTARDPGLAAPLDTWVDAPVPGSMITLVGDGDTNAQLARYVPALRVDYRLQDGVVPAGGLPALEVHVRVREITRDPDRDDPALEDGAWIRVFPVEKVCTSQLDDTLRGAYQ